MPLRIYLYAALAAFLAYTLWHDHRATAQRNQARIEATQAKADITALQAAQAHERKIATEASNEFQRTVTALQAARADTPVRRVRLCTATSVPGTPDATARAVAADPNGLAGEAGSHPRDRWSDDGPDIGPELYALTDEMNKAAAQCNSLTSWVNSR